MSTNESQKEWIRNASYYTLLERWRHSPSGDTMFVDELGKFYASVMSEKRNQLTELEQVRTSKDIGW